MRFSLAALTALSLLPHSYAPQTFYRLDTFAPYPLQEAAEAARKPKDNGGQKNITNLIYAKILANTLYTQMEQKDNIFILFFESYGGKHKGFYVERNLPNEPKHLILHAEDQKNGVTAAIKVCGKFRGIDSIIIKKFERGKMIKGANVSPGDGDALLLYRRMLEASVWHISEADVSKDPVGFNIAKYNGYIEDGQFVSSLEYLISKAGM